MKENVRKILSGLLLVVFVFSMVTVIRQMLDNGDSEESNLAARELAISIEEPAIPLAELPVPETEPEEIPEATAATESPEPVWIPAPVEDDPYMLELAATDLEALRQVNPDVVGWIQIPNTEVNYPILQGEDNEWYLKYSWNGKANSNGSIFLECRNSPDLTDFNTIIYGHNMKSGAMFGSLFWFREQYYWERHPYVYVVTDEGVFRYEIFSSYAASIDSETYGLSFNQEDTRAEFIRIAVENSQISTGIVPETTDRIITLSTCTGGKQGIRRVVHARLRMIELIEE